MLRTRRTDAKSDYTELETFRANHIGTVSWLLPQLHTRSSLRQSNSGVASHIAVYPRCSRPVSSHLYFDLDAQSGADSVREPLDLTQGEDAIDQMSIAIR
jgi:hypothetical protein